MIDMNPTPALSLSRSLLDDSREMEDVRSVTDWISFFFYIRVSRPRISARSLIINNRRGLALHKMKRKKTERFLARIVKMFVFFYPGEMGNVFSFPRVSGPAGAPLSSWSPGYLVHREMWNVTYRQLRVRKLLTAWFAPRDPIEMRRAKSRSRAEPG